MFLIKAELLDFIILAVFIGISVYWQRQLAGKQGWFRLFGHKSTAIFDLWSIQYFLSGIILTGLIYLPANEPTFIDKVNYFLLICWLAYFWEFIELFMEAGYFGRQNAAWKDGFEHWSNRFIGDPLTAILGMLVYLNFHWTIWPALILNLTWFILNLRRAHSMEIQNEIIQFFKGTKKSTN